MMMASQVRMKKYADLRRRDEQYAVGDQVMLSTANLAKKWSKLSPLFVGPFQVVKVSAEGLNVTLDLPEEYRRLHQPFHVSRVKRYTPSDIEWVGREQLDRPLPDLIDGQPLYEVEAIMGKKFATHMELVYDTRPLVDATSEEKVEAKEAADPVEVKEEEEKAGDWGPRLRRRAETVLSSSFSQSQEDPESEGEKAGRATHHVPREVEGIRTADVGSGGGPAAMSRSHRAVREGTGSRRGGTVGSRQCRPALRPLVAGGRGSSWYCGVVWSSGAVTWEFVRFADESRFNEGGDVTTH